LSTRILLKGDGSSADEIAPWIVVRSNDKKRARINAMRYVLAKSDYDDKDDEVVGEPDPLIVGRALTD
jgi:polyphosphate kinase